MTNLSQSTIFSPIALRVLRARAINTIARTLVALSLVLPVVAHSQSFPTKPVDLVLTYPAGGSSDLIARILAQKMSKIWGQNVTIGIHPGSAGSVGMDFTAHAAPDGYTFVLGNLGPVLINPLISKVSYNMDKDFIPVSLVAVGPNILVVAANSPYKTLGDLLAAAKAKPGTLSFGHSGPGAMSQIGGELIMSQAKVKLQSVSFKGAAASVNDLLAGQLTMVVSDALAVSQLIKDKKVRPLAVTSTNRTPLFPDVPTFAEAGLNGLVTENWWGIFLPANTPQSIVDNYRATIVKVLTDPDLKTKFEALGVESRVSTQDQFRSFMASETKKYTKLVSENGLK